MFVVLAVLAVSFYQSYAQDREKEAAKKAWLAYWNPTVSVGIRWVDDYNKIAKAKSQEGHADSVRAALKRSLKSLAAIEPTAELTDVHAALILKLRTAELDLRKHQRNILRLLSVKTPVFDFVKSTEVTDAISKQWKGFYDGEKSTSAAWKEWQRAAESEGKRIGIEGTFR
jgi:hypothetical protein